MGEDEKATLHTLTSYRKIIDPLIDQHRGRFVNSAGDSVLAQCYGTRAKLNPRGKSVRRATTPLVLVDFAANQRHTIAAQQD